MSTTSGIDLLLVAYLSLRPRERDLVAERVHEEQLSRLAAEESTAASYIRSLRRVREEVGRAPSVDQYRQTRRTLLDRGEEVHEINLLIRHFGSWRAAKEAFVLSQDETVAKVEARFRARLIGKAHRYREETLRETLADCADDLSHVPLVAEYKAWREREMELGAASGREKFLPSDSPYRRRYGSWEAALMHFGFTPEAVAARLELGRERSNASLARFSPS